MIDDVTLIANSIEGSTPADVIHQIAVVLEAIRKTLGAHLLGLYVHGSLALGGFNPHRSDVDLLAVVLEPLGIQTKRALAQAMLSVSNRPRPIEATFVAQRDAAAPVHPVPFEFHYSEMWRTPIQTQLETGSWTQWNDRQLGDPDLAGQLLVTRTRGIRLFGPPPADLIGVVSHADAAASFLQDCQGALQLIENDPVYSVLNPCRTWAYIKENSLFSKVQAGIWALQHVPETLRAVITAALDAYAGKGSIMLSKGEIEHFRQFMQMKFDKEFRQDES